MKETNKHTIIVDGEEGATFDSYAGAIFEAGIYLSEGATVQIRKEATNIDRLIKRQQRVRELINEIDEAIIDEFNPDDVSMDDLIRMDDLIKNLQQVRKEI